jgi:uncharacterized membrane protein YqhA
MEGKSFIGLAISAVIGITVLVQVVIPVIEDYTATATDATMIALLGLISLAFAAGIIYTVLKGTDLA